MMHKRLVTVLLAVCCLLAASAVHAESVPQLFKRVQGSVLVIHVPGEVGSGVLIDGKGLVMTAAHVVQAAEDIQVEFITGEKVPAHVIASEPQADVALIQLKEVPAKAVVSPLGDSDQVEVGENVIVIGAPMGISYTLTAGIISSRRDAKKLYGGFEKGELFQTDAAINPGNSGGPLFNMRGEVIGIVSHILTEGGGSEGLGFAVTSNTARKLLLQQKARWSGVETHVVQGELARILNLPQPMGIMVQKVAPNSYGAKLKLRASTSKITFKDETVPVGGDIILSVGGIEFNSKNTEAVREYIQNLKSGDTLRVKILRGGTTLNLSTQIP